jgi:hypothetical protein
VAVVRMRGEGERFSGCPAASGDVNVSLAVRSLRAAVFAVLCVLLAAGGHVLAMGAAPPVRVQVLGALPVFVVGCLLGGRERSLVAVGAGTLAAQGGLHLAFDAGRPHAVMAMHGLRMSHAHPHSHALTPHATAVHVVAALVLTWWLRRGEAALWSLLRRAVVFVPGCPWGMVTAAVEAAVRRTPARAAEGDVVRRPTLDIPPSVRRSTRSCPRHAPPCAAPASSPLSPPPGS